MPALQAFSIVRVLVIIVRAYTPWAFDSVSRAFSTRGIASTGSTFRVTFRTASSVLVIS